MFQDIQASPLKIVLSSLACQIILVACAEAGRSKSTAKSDAISDKAKQNIVVKASPSASASASRSGSIERGGRIFKREMCAGCHADGNNDLMPTKPIKGPAFARRYANENRLGKIIRQGFPASGMPAYGEGRISKAEMNDLILYIRSFTLKSE